MTNLDPSPSRMSLPTSPRRCRWSVGIRRGMQSPPLPACGRCRSPARSSAGSATDCRYRPGAPVYRPCVVTVDDAIVAIQRDDQHRSPIVCWFSSQLAWISRSPMNAGQLLNLGPSMARGPSGSVRNCPRMPRGLGTWRARGSGTAQGRPGPSESAQLRGPLTGALGEGSRSGFRYRRGSTSNL